MSQFNKAAFDNTFSAMTVLQEQMEKMVKQLSGAKPLDAAEGKKAITDWIKAYKQGGKGLSHCRR